MQIARALALVRGRRMADLAAHLVEGVIPDVPTRQWPAPKWPRAMPSVLRLYLAADPGLCRDVASASIDAVIASPCCA